MQNTVIVISFSCRYALIGLFLTLLRLSSSSLLKLNSKMMRTYLISIQHCQENRNTIFCPLGQKMVKFLLFFLFFSYQNLFHRQNSKSWWGKYLPKILSIYQIAFLARFTLVILATVIESLRTKASADPHIRISFQFQPLIWLFPV